MRNEDFFALRWGVPDFIRQHIAAQQAAAALRRRLLRGLRDLHPRARLFFTAKVHGVDMAIRLRKAMAVLQALGPAALRRLHDQDSVFAGRILAPLRRRRRRRCSRPIALAAPTPSCDWPHSSTRAGTSRCTAKASWRCKAKTRITSALTRSSSSRPWTRTTSRSADYVKTVRAGGKFGARRMTPRQTRQLHSSVTTSRRWRWSRASMRDGQCSR